MATLELSITSELPAILELIHSNNVSVLTAPTGSGKSLGVPAAAAAAGYKVFVSVPTRMAAENLASAIKIDVLSNFITGFVTGRDKSQKKSDDKSAASAHIVEGSNIIYFTAGVLKLQMLECFSNGKCIKDIDFCTLLVIDEYHLSILDNEIIVALYLEAVTQGRKVPKLVFMSATPKSFEQLTKLGLAPVSKNIEVKRNVPVTLIYNETDYNGNVATPQLYKDIANKVFSYHRQNTIPNKNILVFCPGLRELNMVEDGIKHLEGKLQATQPTTRVAPYEIYRAHGNMSEQVLTKMLDTSSLGVRKIILSTNVAETSVTLPTISLVVDSMRENVMNGNRLTLSFISKDSALQRMGRTGRTVAEGKCIRMCTKAAFDKLGEHRTPECLRVDLSNYIIELSAKGLPPDVLLKVLGPEDGDVVRTTRNNIQTCISILVSLGMLSVETRETFRRDSVSVEAADTITATPIGLFASKLTLDSRVSRFLYEQKKKFSFNVLASMIDSYTYPYYFFVPPKEVLAEKGENRNDYIAAKFQKYLGVTDIHTLFNIWNDLVTNVTISLNKPAGKELDTWCQNNSMNKVKVREMLSTLHNTLEITGCLKKSTVYPPFKGVDETVRVATLPLVIAFADVVKIFYLETKGDNRGSYAIAHRASNYKGKGEDKRPRMFFNKDDLLCRKQPQMLLALKTHSTKTGDNKPSNKIVLSLEVTKETIAAAERNAKVVELSSLSEADVKRVEVEYSRYIMSKNILLEVKQKGVASKFHKCVERLLLCLAADAINTKGIDPIINREDITTTNNLVRKFYEELVEENGEINNKRFEVQEAKNLVGKTLGHILYHLERVDGSKPKLQLPERLSVEKSGVRIGEDFLPVGNKQMLALLDRGTPFQVILLALRYNSLAMAGQHFSFDDRLFTYLIAELGVTLECYASPLNSRLARLSPETSQFCSLFPDTDTVFGSIGPFESRTYDGISALVNPPYVGSILLVAAKHTISTLTSTNKPVMCFLVYPSWVSSQGYQLLANSQFLRHKLLYESTVYKPDGGRLEGSKVRVTLFALTSPGVTLPVDFVENISSILDRHSLSGSSRELLDNSHQTTFVAKRTDSPLPVIDDALPRIEDDSAGPRDAEYLREPSRVPTALPPLKATAADFVPSAPQPIPQYNYLPRAPPAPGRGDMRGRGGAVRGSRGAPPGGRGAGRGGPAPSRPIPPPPMRRENVPADPIQVEERGVFTLMRDSLTTLDGTPRRLIPYFQDLKTKGCKRIVTFDDVNCSWQMHISSLCVSVGLECKIVSNSSTIEECPNSVNISPDNYVHIFAPGANGEAPLDRPDNTRDAMEMCLNSALSLTLDYNIQEPNTTLFINHGGVQGDIITFLRDSFAASGFLVGDPNKILHMMDDGFEVMYPVLSQVLKPGAIFMQWEYNNGFSDNDLYYVKMGSFEGRVKIDSFVTVANASVYLPHNFSNNFVGYTTNNPAAQAGGYIWTAETFPPENISTAISDEPEM